MQAAVKVVCPCLQHPDNAHYEPAADPRLTSLTLPQPGLPEAKGGILPDSFIDPLDATSVAAGGRVARGTTKGFHHAYQ